MSDRALNELCRYKLVCALALRPSSLRAVRQGRCPWRQPRCARLPRRRAAAAMGAIMSTALGANNKEEGVSDSLGLLRQVEVPPVGDAADVYRAVWALPDRRAPPAARAAPFVSLVAL